MNSKTCILFAVLLACVSPWIFSSGNHDNQGRKTPSIARQESMPEITEKKYPENNVAGKKATLIGIVTMYGTEPDVWIGLSDDSKRVYRIKSDAAAADLQQVQGNRVEISGVIQERDPASFSIGGEALLYVSSWRIVK